MSKLKRHDAIKTEETGCLKQTMACSLLQHFFSSTLFHYNKINKL